ncbi:MAG TPA: alkaline phosphatase [Paludibacteraceae bacterium]|nr:alkaline phosphatase [Paludibacteraceae bacterium]HQB68854.1 alkaline phosphatase [Paludibacteraceae bacterium]HRS68012.1 alkaline phosphatase [Paludibacteraceae bacterium]
MKFKSIVLVFNLILFQVAVLAQPKAKNVIFMIGDGMGINQVYAAMTANGGHLNLEKCTASGYSKTYSANKYITDSAAGGTALATGTKTNNNMLGVAPDSVTKLWSSLYFAKEQGLSTGIVVTVSVTHATPASFYAHQTSRNMRREITQDLLKSDIDVIIGGGLNNFNKKTKVQFEAKNYQIVETEEGLENLRQGKVLALLASKDLPSASKRGEMLPNSVEKAISILSQDTAGFFLMVEGSQIDYQGHARNTTELINEMLDFDKAIGKALDFAEQDGNTLVVITADHETGAFTILDGNFETGEVKGKFNSFYHTGVPVPVFAYGPGSEQFNGWQENTDFRDKILNALNIKL